MKKALKNILTRSPPVVTNHISHLTDSCLHPFYPPSESPKNNAFDNSALADLKYCHMNLSGFHLKDITHPAD